MNPPSGPSSLARSRGHLQVHCQVIQQKVKTPEEFARFGRVIRLFPDREYGFIERDDGLEVYFHAHAVKKGGFAQLRSGTPVKFGQEEGLEGPQATWVQPL